MHNVIVNSGGKMDMKSETVSLKEGFYAKAGSTVNIKSDNSWVCPAGSIQSVSFFPLTNIGFEVVGEPQMDIFTNPYEELPSQPIVDERENEVHFFPNPVDNILNLQLSNRIEGEIKITIVDIKGQPVYSQHILNNVDNVIDCSRFPTGVYFVTVAFKENIQTFKMVKN